MGVSLYDERVPLCAYVRLVAADGTTKKQFWYLGGSTPMRLDDVILTTNSATDRVVNFVATISAVDYQLGSVTVPAGSGYLGVLAVNAFASLAPLAHAGLPFMINSNMYVKLDVAMGGSDVLDVVGLGGVL